MNRPLVALLAALFAGGVAAAPVRALLPAYVESVLHQPPLLTGTILAVQLASGGIFALAGGAVSDLVSRRAAVLVGMTTAICGATLFAVQAPGLLIALAAVWGIAAGFQSTGGQSFLMAAVSGARLGSASAVYFVSGTASTAVGAWLAGMAADRWGFRAVAAAGALLGLLALLLAARFLPPLGADGARTGRAALAPGRTRGDRSSWTWRGYAGLLARQDVLALGALRYFPTVAWGAAALAMPLLVFRLSQSNATVGLYAMVSLLAASGAQLLTGRQIDRLTRRPGLTGGARQLVVPLSGAILCAATGAALWHASLAGLFVAGTLWAMSAWALSTTMPPLIHELGGGQDDGRLVAVTHLLWSAGMLTGTLAAGILIDRHPAAPFLLAIACLAVTVLAGVCFARLPQVSPALERSLPHAAG